MSQAPERIYLDGDVEAGDGMFPRCFENPKYASEPQVEYVRIDLVESAEQRGYANAMEAERKLHEARIEELEAELYRWKDRCRHLSGDLANVLAGRDDDAVRIEELEAERDAAREYAGEVRKREMAAEDARINVTDKLSKAVEVLERIETASEYFALPEAPDMSCRYAHETTRRLARAFLATIQPEGETE